MLLTFNENTPLKGVMVNLAGDFPTEILTSEKHVKDIIGNKTMTSKLNLFVPFMALIFKKHTKTIYLIFLHFHLW